LGYHPEVILAGRRVANLVGFRIGRQCIRMMMRRNGGKGLVTVLGLTFKENVPDIRNSKVIDIVHELAGLGIPVQVYDPIAAADEAELEYGIRLCARDELEHADALIFAVPHRTFDQQGWPLMTSLLKNGTGIVLDVKASGPAYRGVSSCGECEAESPSEG
jgi:UDP-N-acetyl-D-galactosamine dehydrogenase